MGRGGDGWLTGPDSHRGGGSRRRCAGNILHVVSRILNHQCELAVEVNIYLQRLGLGDNHIAMGANAPHGRQGRQYKQTRECNISRLHF